MRAALVPTHVFIEMSEPGGKVFEIETTSATGFDWIHDERFYREGAATWSGQRGLRPVTLDEYQHRIMLEPYQLAAEAMIDSYQGDDDAVRLWRHELAGVIDPDRAELQKGRVQVYDNGSMTNLTLLLPSTSFCHISSPSFASPPLAPIG